MLAVSLAKHCKHHFILQIRIEVVLQYGAESIRVLHARTLPYSHLVVCLCPNIPALQQPPFAPPNHPNSIPLQCPPDPPASNSSPSLTFSTFQPEHAPFQPSSTIHTFPESDTTGIVTWLLVLLHSFLASCYTLSLPLTATFHHLTPLNVTHHSHYPASTDLFQSFTSHVVSGNCISVAALTQKEQMFDFHKDLLGIPNEGTTACACTLCIKSPDFVIAAPIHALKTPVHGLPPRINTNDTNVTY
ncbi:hypothetical protein M405DRAFT_836643 [Rhizopogon salebrosus TDB-379]|nr:hypothetical protein M405DRAFT_836643 [Rhizopogon salebrosus TDB-379]